MLLLVSCLFFFLPQLQMHQYNLQERWGRKTTDVPLNPMVHVKQPDQAVIWVCRLNVFQARIQLPVNFSA